MLMKLVIIVFFLVTLYCLGSALFFMLKPKRHSADKMVRALTWRIALSITLFVLLFIAAMLGWLTPHGIMPVG